MVPRFCRSVRRTDFRASAEGGARSHAAVGAEAIVRDASGAVGWVELGTPPSVRPRGRRVRGSAMTAVAASPSGSLVRRSRRVDGRQRRGGVQPVDVGRIL